MESERAMLAHRASHDTLTAMPNRAAFDEQLARRIEAATQRGAGLALLFIDADQFKTANDNFGHAAGDAVLVAMSERIKVTLRKQDFAARVGGDEFVVIVDPVEARREADELADRIRHSMAEPIGLPGGDTYRIGVSIGVALSPEDGDAGTPPLTPTAAGMSAEQYKHRH